MKKLIIYFWFFFILISSNAQQSELLVPNTLEPINFYVNPMSSIASWEASSDTTLQPIQYRLFINDTLYAEVLGDVTTYQFACLTFADEYTAKIQAVYEWTVSELVFFSWTSSYLPTVQAPFISYIPGANYMTFTLQTITECTGTGYPEGLVSFNIYENGINITNFPCDPFSYPIVIQTLYIPAPGTYTYCASAVWDLSNFGFPGELGESAISACDTLEIIITEVENHISQQLVQIFPNPASNQITLSSKNIISSIAIYNQLSTRVLFNDNMYSQKETVDISKLESGVYTIQVVTTKGTINKQIVKL